jgi:hypothetical protein
MFEKTLFRLPVVVAALTVMAFTSVARADTFGEGGNQFTIDFVDIGNPNNPADDTGAPNPAGTVPYVYRMGKYEISRDMITKANTEDPLEITLYDMTSYGGNGADKPATGVSWNEAARFINWLNTSEDFTPAYKFAVQPGEDGYNANANIELWESGDPGYNSENLFRNDLAAYFLPSVDEWYKAAYHDPSGSYFDYPTGSDTAPDPVASGTVEDTAVYQQATSTGPADITLAGGLSPYGTMGQGGNVWEWEESEYDLDNNSAGSLRGLRGGYWYSVSGGLRASVRYAGVPSYEDSLIGFRVASVPEPGSITLLLCGLVTGLIWWRRRK